MGAVMCAGQAGFEDRRKGMCFGIPPSRKALGGTPGLVGVPSAPGPRPWGHLTL